MASMWIFVVLAIFAGASASSNNRIIGGNPTTIDHYPSLVQVDFFGRLSRIWTQSCAAVIITRLNVLSAAYCFTGPNANPNMRRIRAGSTIRNRDGLVRYVRQATNHPDFARIGFDSDISVITLWEPLEYSPVIQQATIPMQGSVIPDNLPVVHAGWGTTAFGQLPTSILQDVVIYTINNDFCRLRYLELPRPMPVTPNMICVGLLDVGGRGPCRGDGGAPLYYGSIAIGLYSWGHGCANASFPDVSTSIASYTNWIISQVN